MTTTNPTVSKFEGMAFSVDVDDKAAWKLKRATIQGAAPTRVLRIETVDQGYDVEATLKEVAGDPDTFRGQWSYAKNPSAGQLTLRLYGDPTKGIALIGEFSGREGGFGYWAFELFPSDEEDE